MLQLELEHIHYFSQLRQAHFLILKVVVLTYVYINFPHRFVVEHGHLRVDTTLTQAGVQKTIVLIRARC